MSNRNPTPPQALLERHKNFLLTLPYRRDEASAEYRRLLRIKHNAAKIMEGRARSRAAWASNIGGTGV